jgi:hypothetical protein
VRTVVLILLLSLPVMAQNKSVWIWSTAVATSATIDIESTQAGLRNGGYEINPMLGEHPSRLRMYSTIGAIDATAMLGAIELRKHHKKYWWAVPAIAVAVHVAGTIYTFNHLD